MQTTKGDEAGGGATIDPSHPQLSFVVHPLGVPTGDGSASETPTGTGARFAPLCLILLLLLQGRISLSGSSTWYIRSVGTALEWLSPERTIFCVAVPGLRLACTQHDSSMMRQPAGQQRNAARHWPRWSMRAHSRPPAACYVSYPFLLSSQSHPKSPRCPG